MRPSTTIARYRVLTFRATSSTIRSGGPHIAGSSAPVVASIGDAVASRSALTPLHARLVGSTHRRAQPPRAPPGPARPPPSRRPPPPPPPPPGAPPRREK